MVRVGFEPGLTTDLVFLLWYDVVLALVSSGP